MEEDRQHNQENSNQRKKVRSEFDALRNILGSYLTNGIKTFNDALALNVYIDEALNILTELDEFDMRDEYNSLTVSLERADQELADFLINTGEVVLQKKTLPEDTLKSLRGIKDSIKRSVIPRFESLGRSDLAQRLSDTVLKVELKLANDEIDYEK